MSLQWGAARAAHPIADLPALLAALDLHPALIDALTELRLLVSDEPQAWLIVSMWVSQRQGTDGNLHHASILARHAAPLGPPAHTRATEMLYRRLGSYASENWEGSRMRRLPAKMAPI